MPDKKKFKVSPNIHTRDWGLEISFIANVEYYLHLQFLFVSVDIGYMF